MHSDNLEHEIARVVQSVNEWDDRTSPDEYPEHLLITSEELADILRNFSEVVVQDAVDSTVRLIGDQAAAMAEMSISGLPENSRNREAMEAAFTRIAQIIRASRTVITANVSSGTSPICQRGESDG